MARFLFTLWPFPGHVHPNVAIAHALRERGHEPTFYTGAAVRASLEKEGFRCFPFHAVNEARVEEIIFTLDALSLSWWRAPLQKALLREWLVGTAEAQLRDLSIVLSDWRPDVIVCDPGMWGPLLVLQEKEGIPLAVMSYVAACMLPGPEGPIVGLPLPRPKGHLAHAGRRVLRSIANVLAADVRRGADEFRARHNLPPIRASVTAFAGRMPLYLVPSTPLYDRQRSDLPPSVRYVGPCRWDKPRDARPPSWLSELPRDRPVVYVTEGTMHAKAPLLLRAALEGLASLPVRVVATTGERRDPATVGLGTIPPNARVERFVPHSDLFPRIDAIVTTGGTGTVMAALLAGVPLVVVPTAWDQPENAWRIAEAGAGIRLTARTCTPERLGLAVDRVLSDPSFRHNARRLGADLAEHGGAAQAAELLEGLAFSGKAFARDHRAAPAPFSSSRGAGVRAAEGRHRGASPLVHPVGSGRRARHSPVSRLEPRGPQGRC